MIKTRKIDDVTYADAEQDGKIMIRSNYAGGILRVLPAYSEIEAEPINELVHFWVTHGVPLDYVVDAFEYATYAPH